MSNQAAKAQLRQEALEARAKVTPSASVQAAGILSSVLAGYRGVPLAGYMPMRHEADPRPAMEEAAAHGPVGVPVIKAKATPLGFRQWSPEVALIRGQYGAMIPVSGPWITPEIIIVPLVAWSASGGRLGYGGGFYDRTLEMLRSAGPVLAIGYGFDAQRHEALPLEPTDQPLDLMVTETGVFEISGPNS